MKTALIIHGHFYQPPREDPFTGVFPVQSSAAPYTDWNEAVFKTCYEPNAYSRYLQWNGKIENIYNNYENISFNFGPTLLHWIDIKHPAFMEKLIEADKISVEKWGHSNIIAQTYNHVILPLESKENKKIQISWAIEDYTERFGHAPEGFWCAECAIDRETVDVLSEEGIKFVILSPWQAKSINGKDLDGEPAPYDRPFILKGVNRTITAFFYNGDYASGISFGHLLRDADNLYKNIKDYIKEERPSLLHWATDGEIYGHHEPFGDMALAALCKKVQDNEDFYLTNYGAYMEKHPATEEAELYLGEDGLGSSWSCSHGVKRWYTDCGCHTGGDEKWNQAWRTPLRKAFQNLENNARKIYNSEIKKIFGTNFNSEDILLSYGKVLSGKISAYDFVSSYTEKHSKNLTSKDITNVLKLLESVKNSFYSFTSCGWFFNDISGIEPTQNIKYAIYAAKTLEKFTKEPLVKNLLTDLKEAKSNISGDGKTIAENFVSDLPGEVKACGFFEFRRKSYIDPKKDTTRYGIFLREALNGDVFTIKNTLTLETHLFECKEESDFKKNRIQLIVTDLQDKKVYPIDMSLISVGVLQDLTFSLNRRITSNYKKENILDLSTSLDKYLTIAYLKADVVDHISILENVNIFIKALFSDCFNSDSLEIATKLHYISSLSKLIGIIGKEEPKESLSKFFNAKMSQLKKELRNGTLTDENANYFIDVLEIARKNNINADITDVQNELWNIIQNPIKLTITKETFSHLRAYLNFA